MNTCIVMGRLTKDVDIKNTNSGKAYCRFSVAVPRNYKNANGGYDADFINCIAWGSTAGFISKYFQKGSRILVTGSIMTSSYKDNEGVTRNSVELSVASAEFTNDKASTTNVDTSARPETKGKPVAPSMDDDLDFGDLPF